MLFLFVLINCLFLVMPWVFHWVLVNAKNEKECSTKCGFGSTTSTYLNGSKNIYLFFFMYAIFPASFFDVIFMALSISVIQRISLMNYFTDLGPEKAKNGVKPRKTLASVASGVVPLGSPIFLFPLFIPLRSLVPGYYFTFLSHVNTQKYLIKK